jgi:uncharacterized damage-inducible protein DinB
MTQIAQAFLAEFEQEVPITKKFLERVPQDKLTWKPHPKSRSAGQLALHIATAPGQVIQLASQDSVPLPNFGAADPDPRTVRETLEALEQSAAAVRQYLMAQDDARMQRQWRVVQDGKDVMVMPRAAFLRSILLNHWYQHRGQLGVYLRLLGAKVPSSYGPSADELPEFLKGH